MISVRVAPDICNMRALCCVIIFMQAVHSIDIYIRENTHLIGNKKIYYMCSKSV